MNNPPFKDLELLNGPAYYQTCPILHSNERLRFRYHEYTTDLVASEQLEILRTISSHALVFLLEGEFNMNWEDQRDILVRAGEMFFLQRGAEVSGYIKGDVSFVVAIIDRGLTSKELNDLRMMKEYEQFKHYKFKPMVMHPPMLRLAESVKDYLVRGVNCAHLHEAKFNELYVILHWYYSQADNAQLFYPMAGAVSEFRDFILKNYHITTSMQEILEKSNMSRSTFDRKFKETFSTTPHKWIEEHTRQMIVSRASEPNVTVKDIMYEVGVYNPSQFTQLCKRLCGVIPSKLIRP